MVEKAYGFVLREGADGRELLVFEQAGVPEAGLQVPGGTVEERETPIQAVSREVLEESGLSLGGWQAVTSFETDGQRWHCYATAPGFPLARLVALRTDRGGGGEGAALRVSLGRAGGRGSAGGGAGGGATGGGGVRPRGLARLHALRRRLSYTGSWTQGGFSRP